MTEYFITESSVGQEGIKKARECLWKAGVISKDTEYDAKVTSNTPGAVFVPTEPSKTTGIYLNENLVFRDDLIFTAEGKTWDEDVLFFRFTANVPYGKREAAKTCLK